VAAGVARGGDVGFSSLPGACVAVDPLDEYGAAASAYVSSDVCWEFGACALGYASEELDVSAAEVRVGGVGLLRSAVQYLYALFCDASRVVVGHFSCGLGGWKVYKTIGL